MSLLIILNVTVCDRNSISTEEDKFQIINNTGADIYCNKALQRIGGFSPSKRISKRSECYYILLANTSLTFTSRHGEYYY